MITVDFKRLDIKAGFRILDIGCGSGRHTCAAYRCPQITAVGADIAFSDLKAAAERLQLHDRLGEHGGGCWALCGADITRLPFKDDCFDLVICSEVMEHIVQHRTAAREIVRILKPAANLVVSVPRYWPERICWALSREYPRSRGGHIRIFKKKELIALLENLGLKTWAVHFAHSLHTPYWWLKCLMGPQRDDCRPVNLYHRFLTWDIMQHPGVTRGLDCLLNPLMGKSLVVYLKKAKGER